MENKYYKGDLVRWLNGHSVYESDGINLVGAEPIYSYGIVVEVSHVDPDAIIVSSCMSANPMRLVILNTINDDVEILSGEANRNG